MKNHNEFMKEAADANSLPAQTQRALAPESDEDIAMYLQEYDEITGNAKEELDRLTEEAIENTDKIMDEAGIERLTKEQVEEIKKKCDVSCEGGENEK